MDLNLPTAIGLAVFFGALGGYFFRYLAVSKSKKSLEAEAEGLVVSAKSEAKEIIVTAKDEAARALADAQKDERERKAELRRLEDHLLKKEAVVERVAGFSKEEAKARMFTEMESVAREELMEKLIKLERDKMEQLEAKALEVI